MAFLTEQQKAIAGSTYVQLKPVVMTTCKGTLQRLSKLPGWNRQSIRKKWVSAQPTSGFVVSASVLDAAVNLHVLL